MKKETDPDALRERDDSQKLLADLEAATQPTDKKQPSAALSPSGRRG